MGRKLVLYIATLALPILPGLPEAATAVQVTSTWDGGIGFWNVATNWTPDVVPNNAVDTYNVLIDGGMTGITSDVGLDTSPTIDNLTIDANDSLSILNNRRLTLRSGVGAGTITNAGIIALLDDVIELPPVPTDLRISGGNVTLTGGGTVILPTSPENRIRGAASTDRLINENNLIQGAGKIGDNFMALTNRGVIEANEPMAPLTIDPSATGAINQGIMRAVSGGTLSLQVGPFDNTSGLIQADGGRVNLAGASVTGGTIEARADSVVAFVGGGFFGGTLQTSDTAIIGNSSVAGLQNVTLSGRFVQLSGTTTFLLPGTFTNQGTYEMLSVGSPTRLDLRDGDVTLTGSGMLTMSDNALNRIGTADAATRRLTNQSTIQGAGQILFIALTNEGVIEAHHPSGRLTIDPSTRGAINTGTLRARSGGVLRLKGGTFTNTGGIIEAQDGSVVELGENLATGPTIVGGTLHTTDTGVIRNINTTTLQNVTLSSTFEQPNGTTTFLLPGTFTNQGTYKMLSTGSLTELRPSGGDVTLTGGGTLILSDSNIPNNIIRAADVSTRRLINENNTIQGAGGIGAGFMALTNRGTIIATSQTNQLTIQPSASGFTNEGTLRANAGSTLEVTALTNLNPAGTILTGGTYEVFGTMGLAFGTNIATNAATILLDGGGSQIQNLGGGDGLANFATNTAAGSFTIQNGRNFTTIGAFSNAGNVTLGTGSTFTVGGAATNDYVQTAGLTTVNGTLVAPDRVDIDGGTLAGTGTIIATVVENTGEVSPGLSPDSPGQLTVQGDYMQNGGTLEIELGGTTPGSQFDRLTIAGSATLDGMLDVSLIDGFMPAAGQQFTILTAGNIINNGLALAGPAASSFSLLVNNFSVILQAIVAPLPGDYNADGAVDTADYVLWRKDPASFGGDPAGYNTWRANFGGAPSAGWSAGSGSSAAVPEPAGVMLVVLALGLRLGRCRCLSLMR